MIRLQIHCRSKSECLLNLNLLLAELSIILTCCRLAHDLPFPDIWSQGQQNRDGPYSSFLPRTDSGWCGNDASCQAILAAKNPKKPKKKAPATAALPGALQRQRLQRAALVRASLSAWPHRHLLDTPPWRDRTSTGTRVDDCALWRGPPRPVLPSGVGVRHQTRACRPRGRVGTCPGPSFQHPTAAGWGPAHWIQQQRQAPPGTEGGGARPLAAGADGRACGGACEGGAVRSETDSSRVAQTTPEEERAARRRLGRGGPALCF